ncbi:hypothetical protein KR093_007713 [Drosophila rubida]|uniref:Uncharacterized protein n=1 Tax=Drosophila rubida TaxID=30044 RepID=A0AAD4PGP2_9MUSC|nr:hypothetical protein KR093_007713 [Drosophila rubida]
MQCQAAECAEKVCCRDSRSDLREVSDSPMPTSPKTTKSCAELSAIVVEKPKELSVSQLLQKAQSDSIADEAASLPVSPSSISLPATAIPAATTTEDKSC